MYTSTTYVHAERTVHNVNIHIPRRCTTNRAHPSRAAWPPIHAFHDGSDSATQIEWEGSWGRGTRLRQHSTPRLLAASVSDLHTQTRTLALCNAGRMFTITAINTLFYGYYFTHTALRVRGAPIRRHVIYSGSPCAVKIYWVCVCVRLCACITTHTCTYESAN